MSLHYFNVQDGWNYLDDQGTDFPDLAAAKSGAVVLAADLLKETALTFWDGEEWSMDVSDGGGLILLTLRLTGQMAPALN
jgi:hypothetical protein